MMWSPRVSSSVLNVKKNRVPPSVVRKQSARGYLMVYARQARLKTHRFFRNVVPRFRDNECRRRNRTNVRISLRTSVRFYDGFS